MGKHSKQEPPLPKRTSSNTKDDSGKVTGYRISGPISDRIREQDEGTYDRRQSER